MLIVSKILTTSAGKVMLMQIIRMSVQKVAASAALKMAIYAAIKKVGIGLVVKTVAAKAILALLALVGISGIPIAWVILPILGVMLVRDYKNFPAKLAQEVPSSITSGIKEKFDVMNTAILEDMIKESWDNLITEVQKQESQYINDDVLKDSVLETS